MNRSVKCLTCTDEEWKITDMTPEKYMQVNYTYHTVNIDRLYNTAAKKPFFFWVVSAGDMNSKGENFSVPVTEKDSA